MVKIEGFGGWINSKSLFHCHFSPVKATIYHGVRALFLLYSIDRSEKINYTLRRTLGPGCSKLTMLLVNVLLEF